MAAMCVLTSLSLSLTKQSKTGTDQFVQIDREVGKLKWYYMQHEEICTHTFGFPEIGTGSHLNPEIEKYLRWGEVFGFNGKTEILYNEFNPVTQCSQI